MTKEELDFQPGDTRWQQPSSEKQQTLNSISFLLLNAQLSSDAGTATRIDTDEINKTKNLYMSTNGGDDLNQLIYRCPQLGTIAFGL